MANSINQTGRVELQWDDAAIQRNQLNLESAYAIWVALEPTSLLPACWALLGVNAVQPYIFKIAFSSDTAIAWTLKQHNQASAYTPFSPEKLGATSAANQCTPQAQVAAAPGAGQFIAGGFAAAGSYVDVLQGRWLLPTAGTGIILFTSTIAANCGCAIWWSEYSN